MQRAAELHPQDVEIILDLVEQRLGLNAAWVSAAVFLRTCAFLPRDFLACCLAV
jgi:hypothetical protein